MMHMWNTGHNELEEVGIKYGSKYCLIGQAYVEDK